MTTACSTPPPHPETTPTAILALESPPALLPLDTLWPHPGPLHVDVGCGKGHFLLARAQAEPGTHFLGIDRLLARLRRIDRKINRRCLGNVRLIRYEALTALEQLLPPATVSCFYVFFPDPWPKRRHHRRRLFQADFLDAIERALRPGGLCHVASDHLAYVAEIRRLVRPDPRFQPASPMVPRPEDRSDFERLFKEKGDPIARISFRKHPAPR